MAILRLPNEALNDPERFTCKSQTLVDITNRQRQIQQGKSRSGGLSSEGSDNLVVSSVNYPRDTHRIQWQFRRRDSSDHSIQPHSAPPGFAAQQSENFQRFYRAVVSPTHVRVTAGGRIVPNTRSIAPPVFEWNKDKFAFDPPKTLPEINLIALQQSSWQQAPPAATSFSHPQPQPGYLAPYDRVPGVDTAVPLAMDSQDPTRVAQADKHALEETQAHYNAGAVSENVNNSAPPPSIKLSHPSHFDQSKPFMFNGHLVYPLPAGHQPPPHAMPIPFTVLGNPNFASQHATPSAPSFFPQPLHFPFGQLGNPMMLPMMHQQQQALRHPGENIPNVGPFFPTPGFVSAQDFTKHQIQGFYNHLKNIDNQLASNTQGMDETYLLHQRNEFVATIAKMEAMLESEVIHAGQEQGNKRGHRGSDISVETYGAHGSNSTEGLHQKQRPGRESSLQGDVKASAFDTAAIFSKPKFVPVHISAPGEAPGEGTKYNAPTDITKVTEPDRTLKHVTRSEPAVKSKLTAAAAMAPPFQPRAQAMVASNNFVGSENVHHPGERGYLADSHLQHGGYGNFSRTRSMHETSLHAQDSSFPAPMNRGQTFHVPSAVPAHSMQPAIPPHAVPYLVGVLPQGLSVSEAKATDLVYSRPLNDEEVRARYLYWGKAPRFIQSGLPKFDGKDFYPPSPLKQQAQPAPKLLGSRSELAGSSQGFENYFSSASTGQGYKTPSPVRTMASLPNIGASSTQMFLENGVIGFQSPSPRPSAYRYDASVLPAYSASSQPYTPATSGTYGTSSIPVEEDFSHLFLERGVPGYKSPTPPPQSGFKMGNGDNAVPVTPTNPRQLAEANMDDDEVATLDSWGAPTIGKNWRQEETEHVTSIEPDMDDAPSESSTVEINLISKVGSAVPKLPNGLDSPDAAFDFSKYESPFLLKPLYN